MAGSSFRYRLQQIEVGGIYDTALAQEIEKMLNGNLSETELKNQVENMGL